jgi:hypothetical protein
MTVTISPAPETTYRVTSTERHNAKAWARKFQARLLEPGIISYEDMGCGKAYLTRESIENSAHTFIGRPLILTPKLRHKKVTPKELEKEARGYITGTFWGPDGWLWADGICHDDEAKDAINKVGFCSCAYEVKKAGTGGEYHAIPYHEEILEFSGEHLAIVDKPRYEGATIRLNSKTKPHTTMFKWIKKIASRQNATEAPAAPAAVAAPAAPAKIEAVENSVAEEITGTTELEIPTRENGKTEKVTLAELVEVYNARADGVGAEDTLEIDGKPVPVSDIVAGYKANAMKPNAVETDEEKTKRENAEKEKEEKNNKKNAKAPVSHFKVLLNARNHGTFNEGPKIGPDDIISRVNRGQERYGKITPGKN